MNADPRQQWVLSSSPHAHSGASVRGIMLTVVVALAPALLVAFCMFGWRALLLVAVCVVTCVVSEGIARRMMGRDSGIADMSAVVTGLLLAFNLPPGLPVWMAVFGSIVAILIGKQVFGGLGYNPFNPALVGRVVLFFSFPVAMNTWQQAALPFGGLDAVTTATPLGVWKTAWANGAAPVGYAGQFPLLSLFLGRQSGCIGEVSALALLVGGLFLVRRRCVSWQLPVCYLATVALFAGVLHALDPARNVSPAYHLCSGGLMLGAFFMATDMVTGPVTRRGRIVFGIGCGILTIVIRRWGGPAEGVSFAILLMNSVTPLINRYARPRVFGTVRAR